MKKIPSDVTHRGGIFFRMAAPLACPPNSMGMKNLNRRNLLCATIILAEMVLTAGGLSFFCCASSSAAAAAATTASALTTTIPVTAANF